MIKYDKFIIESLLETMILEANITYKNDFRDILMAYLRSGVMKMDISRKC
jgi:hypothetical protein